MVEHWKRLPREAATAPTLMEFKNNLNNGLGHMVQFLGMVLCRARSWTPRASRVSSNLAYSVIIQKCISDFFSK